MATGNFPACLAVTLVYEGGYGDIRSDPGNWTGGKVGVGILKGTKYGIAASSEPDEDIKNLTLERAQAIYQRKYWTPIRADELTAGVDLVTFDYGVNSGISRSAKCLQSIVGAAVDGVIGGGTIAKVLAGDGKAIIQKMCAKRLSFLQDLAIFKTFGKGWSARVASVEAKGVAMFLAASGHENVKAALTEEAQSATDTAKKQNAQATGAVATGGGGATTGAVGVAGPNWLLIAGVVVVALLIAGALVIKARQNKQRAAAYSAEAAS